MRKLLKEKGSNGKLNLSLLALKKDYAYSFWFLPSVSDYVRKSRIYCNVSFVDGYTVLWTQNPVYVYNIYKGEVDSVSLKMFRGWRNQLQHDRVRDINSYTSAKEKGQTYELYCWEQDNLDHLNDTISDLEMTNVVDEILINYDVKYQIEFKPINNLTYARVYTFRHAGMFSKPKMFEFHFNEKMEYKLHYALHEVAHALDYTLYRSMSHGPSFTSIYAHLLDEYQLIKNPAKKMKKYGLSTVDDIRWQ